MCNKLTVIIPFLNEKEEVRNTVKSLRENSNQNFEIILINDCSTDGYNYKQVAIDFDASYVEHSERRGVAASRDEGVSDCKTEYFLFLDAHMRIYQKNWVNIFVEELENDRKALLCALTLSLDVHAKATTHKLGCGACFDFSELGIQWLTCENDASEEKIIDIPCVLGASYACSKEYWLYLEGLNGLKSYGLDEQLISIKVWLDGGRCRLMKDITFGHIFRETTPVPYENRPKDYLKNILFIAELFYGFEMKIELLQKLRTSRGASFVSEVISEIIEGEEKYILESKQRYKNRFINSIDYVITVNNYYLNEVQKTKIAEL